jgi:hypothetical protein
VARAAYQHLLISCGSSIDGAIMHQCRPIRV